MIDIYDGNNVMRRQFEKHIFGTPAMSLRMRYEQTCAAMPGSQIWVWDGREHNERRREIYPLYKMNRTPMGEDIFSQVRLWRDVLKHSHATQIEVHGWEADDVIGTLVRRLARRAPVKVHTNDMDYGQLAHLPNVTLNGVNLKGIPARWIALYKAMVGDTSDNIKGIPNFGPKRWEALRGHWEAVERAVVLGRPEGFLGLPVPPSVAAWLAEQDNVDLLQQMLLVTHLQNVPDDELDGGIAVGVADHRKAHAMLSEFFL